MDVLYVYCFNSVGSYKHKLSRIESLVILYWGINCTTNDYNNNCNNKTNNHDGRISIGNLEKILDAFK